MSSYTKILFFMFAALFLRASSLSNNNNQIITCSSSIELERAITMFCKPEDSVLELGAQLSGASRQLKKVIGPLGRASFVDIQRDESKSGRCTHRDVKAFKDAFPDATLIDLPSLDDWREILFSNGEQYDILIIDLGHMIGNDLCMTTLSLTNEILSMTNPRITLVKSKSLSSLVRRIVPFQRLLDGTSTLPQKNGWNRTSEPFIIPCVGVSEYRRTIPFVVSPGDAVIEVGCHFGRTTAILMEATGGSGICMGVDIGPKIIRSAEKQYPHIRFAVGDAWRTLDLLKLRCDGTLGYDVVYADIGGLSGAHGVLESLSLIDALSNSMEPRCIVIKSLCMRRFATRMRSFSEVWSKEQGSIRRQ